MNWTPFARGAAFAAPALLLASTALASGNEHVVDDAAVETPGVCHLESWATRFGPRQGLLNLSPACTRRAWPRLEIGGGVQHAWAAGRSDTVAGPALKYVLRPEETGLGLGLAGGGGFDLDLVAGRRIDGESPRAVTLGLTMRR